MIKMRNGSGQALLAKHMNHVVEIGEEDEWHLFEIFFEDINDALAAIATYGPDIVVQQPLELKQLLIENFMKLRENHV